MSSSSSVGVARARADLFVDEFIQSIEAGVVCKAKVDGMPADHPRSYGCDFGRLATLGLDHEDIARIIVVALREAIQFWCAGIPRVCGNLLRAVPVAQGDVVERRGRKTLQVD